MLIVIILIVILAITVIYYNVSKKDVDVLCISIGVIDTIILILCVLTIISTHIGTEVQIQNNKITYQSILDRANCIDTEYEDVSKSEIIKEIAEWNKEVNELKYLSNNLWFNWLFNKKVADNLEYIDIYIMGE